MIVDSIRWKQELAQLADALAAQAATTDWPADTQFNLERAIMTGAYAVRRLQEGGCLAATFTGNQVAVTRCPLEGDRPGTDWDRSEPVLWEHYDMTAGTRHHLSMRELCNQIMHSWVWFACMDAGQRFEGVVVASERDMRECVYFVEVQTLISLFRTASQDRSEAADQRDAMIPVDVLRRAESPPTLSSTVAVAVPPPNAQTQD